MHKPFARFENVLPPELISELIDFAITSDRFTPALMSYGVQGFRQATTVMEFGPLAEAVKKYVEALFPEALEEMGLAPYEYDYIETHMTRHGDGDYLALHIDNPPAPGLAKRQIPYCLYFHREPKAFEGGELRLFEGKPGDSDYYKIKPINNSLLFFDGRLLHEVLPVSCPSKDIADGRFTVNGWFWRA